MEMDARKSRLAGVMGLFEKQIDMHTYDNRLILQKLVYLLQCRGIDLDYSFGWYIRGPYSAALAADGFFLSDKKSIPTSIPENEQEIVKEIKLALGNDIKDGNKMEIIASLLFLKKENISLNDTELVALLLGRKPWLDTKEIEENLIKLKGICPGAFLKWYTSR
jgi:uncharacterized protein YwgA